MRGGGRARVRHDGRCAGAHGAAAGGRRWTGREPLLSRPAHDLRNAALAGLANGALEHGQPKFANIKDYAGANASTNEVIEFGRNNIGGAFTWDEVARFR